MADEKSCVLKVTVTEQVHDDFMISGRLLGHQTRADFLNWIIHKELYGIVPHLNITRDKDNKEPGSYTGLKSQ